MFFQVTTTLFLLFIARCLWRLYRPISFSGTKVWITGASSGIGEYLAYEFHRLGAFVILSGRNESELQRVHSALKNSEIFRFDLSDSSTVIQNSKQLLNKHKIDILINNAGVSQRSLFRDSLDNINNERTLMEINYFSVVALTKAFVKSLEGRSGTVVVVSSTAGMLPSIGSTGYSGVKAGIIGYYEAISAELKDIGVKVVNLAPGYVNTDITKNAINAEGKKFGIRDARNEKGIEPAAFAQQAVRRIANGEKRIIIAQASQYPIYYLRSISPATSTLIVKKIMLKVVEKLLKKNN